jgi:hypothetical protein
MVRRHTLYVCGHTQSSYSRARTELTLACACRERTQAIADAKEQRTTNIAQRRAAAAASLPAEPEASAERPCSLIRVRLPNGATAQRRFGHADAVSAIYDWVDSMEAFEAWDYVLTSQYPRKEVARGDETLQDVGLVPNAALLAISNDT